LLVFSLKFSFFLFAPSLVYSQDSFSISIWKYKNYIYSGFLSHTLITSNVGSNNYTVINSGMTLHCRNWSLLCHSFTSKFVWAEVINRNLLLTIYSKFNGFYDKGNQNESCFFYIK
jgi:hypothetical protein